MLDVAEQSLPGAHIYLKQAGGTGTTTDSAGHFYLPIPLQLQQDTLYVVVSFIGHITLKDTLYAPSIPTHLQRRYRLQPDATGIAAVVVHANTRDWALPKASHIMLKTKQLKELPSLSSDVSHVLGLLPGVVANRGLSNSYAVRGGNYQENLLYIEDMPIYTPYLARSGQQEGLSVANISLTDALSFSAGGWEAQYGDKLSSMLNVHYKDPKQTAFGLQTSLLGAEAYVTTKHKHRPWRLLVGTRYKDTRYVLGNLDTKGNYLPRFTDLQALLRIGLSKQPGRSELLLFGAYARNRYFLRPTTRSSTFGTASRQLHFSIDFEGEEVLKHDVSHAGAKWIYNITPKTSIQLLNIHALSYERSYYDIISTFRLCDVIEDKAATTDQCQITVGDGVNFNYGRNFLQGYFSFAQGAVDVQLNEQHGLKVGTFMQHDQVEDRVNTYRFSSVSGYVLPGDREMADGQLQRVSVGGFFQHNFYNRARTRWLNTGIRIHHTPGVQSLFSPRVQFSFLTHKHAPLLYKVSAGLYAQPLFYREMRATNNMVQQQRGAQQSLHLLAGTEYDFMLAGKRFTLYVDAYYKKLYDLIPYEQDDIRIRYHGDKQSHGYAHGIDTRLYGFFVPGQESWLSVSYLHTAEDIMGDAHGYIRRPTDQRMTASLFFRDYLPEHLTWQVYTKLLFGTGMPFNPAGKPHYRNVFDGEDYYQVDLGFSKIFLSRKKHKNRPVSHFLITLEILNLLGSSQHISYTWVGVQGMGQFAVPSTFSAQFFNLKATFSTG